ncbi:MAG: endopeptidase La [Bacteroidales bacterium]|nr:endopeptidase La [Bacteroidales bacterium]
MNLEELGEMIAKGMNVKANIIPMVDTDSEEILLNTDGIENEMPVLPLMDQVLLPGVIIPIVAQRDKSRRLLSDMKTPNQHVLVFPQRDNSDDPDEHCLYPVGVVAKVLKTFEFHNEFTVAILQGVVRCHSLMVHRYTPYMMGTVSIAPETDEGMDTAPFRRRMKLLRKQYGEIMRSRLQDDELGSMLSGIGSDKIFINFASTHIDAESDQKYELLACDSYLTRTDKLLELLGTLKGLDELRREIDNKTQEVIGKQQREYYLRHQMDVIQEELGENGSNPLTDGDVADLRARAAKKQLPKEAAEVFEKEVTKLSRIHPMSPDYSVQQAYLDTLLEIPWSEAAQEHYDLAEARRVLERDHYGIKKVKERVIEYLAVLHRQQSRSLRAKAQVLCLVGPPGTGKTSICRSVAEALGRPYRRVALGGLHDEAEIRGHRRTYVGAMCGRIMQEVIKAGVNNPVFVLDEIDKVQTNTFHGDPSSALLEVLDPEQNSRFHDNFVGVDYDLSHVLFIATANSVADIQPALLDRMEVIDFSGYVLEEKLQIASRHLLPRIMHDNVVDRRTLRFPPEVICKVINEYTREGGVRQLEKQLSKLVRHRVVMLESGVKGTSKVSPEEVKEVLGLPIHTGEHAGKEAREGVVTGLAWTPVGGEILFIEASLSHGKGTITMTGNLGDVMKESATLAFEYLKSNADSVGVSQKTLEGSNIHIHVPEGATPKDGPSAGITMFVAMVSVFSHRKVRPEVAMTGEITLRGDVTPVGGIKEKVLAAKRAGITDLILCRENRRDIEEIDATYLEGLSFHYIDHMSEALPLALAPVKKARK